MCRGSLFCALIVWIYPLSTAQYLVEVLEHTAFDTQRPVLRCEATGANFGPDVLDFSLGPKGVGCAVLTEPADACSDVKIKYLSDYGNQTCDAFFALVSRGNCGFSTKAFFVQNAFPVGADAMIVYNTPGKSPIPMAGSNYSESISIPSVMVNDMCRASIVETYSPAKGYMLALKASPGYYDLIKYLVPFVVIVGFCFLVLFISLLIRLCRERRRLARKRLSRSNLKKIPVKKFKNGEYPETCAICLEDFVENEKIRVLPCYHCKCIDPWLTKNRKVCPICKRKVGPSNDSDSSDSDTERNTARTSISVVSRDDRPLIMTNETRSFGAPFDNSRRTETITNNAFNGDSSTHNEGQGTSMNNEPANTDSGRTWGRRMRQFVGQVNNSMRERFRRSNSLRHSRLENDDDTLSTTLVESDVESAANVHGNGAENSAFDHTPVTNNESRQCAPPNLLVTVDVEPLPPDVDRE